MGQLQNQLIKPMHIQVYGVFLGCFAFQVDQPDHFFDVVSLQIVVFGQLEIIQKHIHLCDIHGALLILHLIKS